MGLTFRFTMVRLVTSFVPLSVLAVQAHLPSADYLFRCSLLVGTRIGFKGTGNWAGYMKGADRLILDSHPYLCFIDQDTSPLSEQVDRPCQTWGKAFNTSLDAYGITIAGEWALSFNDCAFHWSFVFKWSGPY